MSRAFIFDLDGVLVDNERAWEAAKQVLYRNLFGEAVAVALGSTTGSNIDAIYEKARQAGTTVPKQDFVDQLFSSAQDIYRTAPITSGVDELARALSEYRYAIGIVSASPSAWIRAVTERLSFQSDIQLVISLNDRSDLAHKPAPDGYIEAITLLRSTPAATIILEDSNAGIASAKASGAYTVGLRQNLLSGYQQIGADVYADTVRDVVSIVAHRSDEEVV